MALPAFQPTFASTNLIAPSFWDAFTDVVGTSLVAHVPTNAGQYWIPEGQSVATINPSGSLYQSIDSHPQNDMYAYPGPASPDYTVTGIYQNLSLPTHSYMLFGRAVQGLVMSGYRLETAPFGPEVDFFVGNTFIATVSSSFGGAIGPQYTMAMTFVNTVAGVVTQVFLNGVLSYTYTDAANNYPLPGICGLGAGNQTDTATTGSHWLFFSVV